MDRVSSSAKSVGKIPIATVLAAPWDGPILLVGFQTGLQLSAEKKFNFKTGLVFNCQELVLFQNGVLKN